MEISDKDVRRIAELARLSLSAEELALYRGQLGRILEHMERLGELDTSGVPPTAHMLGLSNVLREDEVKPFADREALLKNAPASEGPYFKVPKVLE